MGADYSAGQRNWTREHSDRARRARARTARVNSLALPPEQKRSLTQPKRNKSAFPEDSAIFKPLHPLFLASASPRRSAFLRDIGLKAEVLCPPGKAEPSPLPGEEPARYVLRAAEAKAFSVLPHIPAGPERDCALGRRSARGPVVLAADTIVVLEGRILGKPGNPAEAYAMISALAGKTHSVISGCVILRADAPIRDATPDPLSPSRATCSAPSGTASPGLSLHAFAVESRVRMWDAPPELLYAYANGSEPLDKAGAYAVQGAGAVLAQSIEGSWSNVVGLPLAELVQALLAMNLIAPAGATEG